MSINEKQNNDEFEFSDIAISSDDSIETIIKKHGDALAGKKDPEKVSEIPVENIQPKPRVKKKQNRLKTFFSNIIRMAKEEGLTHPGDFLIKLLFTMYELLVKFFEWFARISRYIILPLSVGLVAIVIIFFTGYTVAIKVSMNDDVIGYVNSAPEYDIAKADAEKKLAREMGDGYQIDMVPAYSLSFVQKSDVIEGEELVDAITTYSQEVVNKKYGLFVDGALVGTNRKQALLLDLLERIKAPYQSGDPSEVAVFLQNVEIVEGEYEDNLNMTINEIYNKLMNNTTLIRYTVTEEDNLNSILAKYSLSRENFILLNPNVNPDAIRVGETINVTETKPIISVQVKRTVNYTVPIPYETVVKYDSGLWENTQTVVTTGVNGMSAVVADVMLVNGVEISREIVSDTVAQEPVSEVVIQGTKKIAPSGNFIWPLKDAYYEISDRYFDWRSDHYHGALDLAGYYGTPIYVADAGEVVEAGWDGSYGYYVLVQHQVGCCTRYAHLSAIETEVGATLYQGQEIGLMGSTGYSTGNHLHFEVLIEGQRVDPELYVSPPR